MIFWPCGFPNDYGAFCFEIATQFVKNGPAFFPDMMQRAIHGNQICRFWQRKRMDIAQPMQAIFRERIVRPEPAA